MKYVLNYTERPAGSARESETNQMRVLELFQSWKMPESLVLHQFVTRVGEFGGYIVFETDNLADLHMLTTVFAVFSCQLQPVIDVVESVGIELKAIAWREANTVKASQPAP